MARFSLIRVRSPLLTESLLFSLPVGTEMFHFPTFPLPALYIQAGVTPHDGCWVAPFGYLRIEAWSAAPRSFSQPPTSFIGFRRQGIHRWLFVAWRIKDARARYEVLKGRSSARRDERPRRCRGRATVRALLKGTHRPAEADREHSLTTEERNTPSRSPQLPAVDQPLNRN